MSKIEIFNCPHCFGELQVEGHQDIQVVGLMYHISCVNPECPVRPSVCGIGIQRAADAWNTRVPKLSSFMFDVEKHEFIAKEGQ